MAVKFWFYSTASLLACAALLWYTYMTRQQFYPGVIYLVTSKISVVILGNAGLVLTMLLGRLVKSIFLGTLRDAEVELLHENVRYAITETCLALTIFRDEINFQVVVLFTSLIFLKIFHWLAQSRIEFIEQTDVVSRLTHMRLVALMTLLGAVDTTFVVICGMKVMDLGPSVFILFGFEFLIMLVTLVAIFLRYVLYVIDMRMDGNWTNKFTYLFYLELVSEIVKLVVYLVFFMLIFTYYGMPLHIVRDLWVSIKNLQRRIASYFRYRKITANLNDRFPNPTEEELQDTDRTCIICREEMTTAGCKKLPCSHIFHIDCLKMWVQRQQTCPTCRSTIPTGVRPPVVPETPAAAAPAQAPAPAHAHAAVPAPGAAVPAAPAHAAAAGNHTQPMPPAGLGANAHAPAAGVHAFPGGYHAPYMGHYMFGAPPHMAMPYGYGMPPGYGVMPGMGLGMGHPHAQGFGLNHAAAPPPPMDPASIQRQIEHLHAQLAMVQAASHAMGIPGMSASAMPAMPPMSSTTAAASVPAAVSPPVSTPASVSAGQTPAPVPTSVPGSSESVSPPAAAPTSSSDDDLEEKASLPASTAASDSTVTTPAPMETAIPRVLTDAERRREELRQRYNRIYASGGSASAASTTSNTDESKKDE